MTDHDELYLRHQVDPEPFWAIAHGSGADGYDTMDAATARGWTAVASWGQDGWDLGTWPYVILFTRTKAGRWELAHYVEGDITTYAFPDQATRDTAIDGTAFWYWKAHERSWVADYQRAEQLPPRFRGPFGAERATTPRLVRVLLIPADQPAEVWYVHPDLATLTAIIGGPLEAVRLSADAHAYCDEEGKLLRKLLNPAATALWHQTVPEATGRDILTGDVIILGETSPSAGEGDCPQWPIDAVVGAQPPAE